MKDTANKRKTTTLSCDKSTREFVAAEAERLGLTQREVLARLVESYRRSHKRSATNTAEPKTQAMPGQIDMNVLIDALSKQITKDVNRVIGFIQQQEKVYLTTIAKNTADNKTLLTNIVTQLENLE